MNIYGFTLDISTDDVSEIPMVGDKLTTEILGEEVSLVVSAVKLERKWRASVVEGEKGTYFYAGAIEFCEDPDADEGEGEEEDPIDKVIAESGRSRG